MKTKQFLSVLCLLLINCIMATAQNNTLSIPNVTAAPGKTISLPINMDNTADVVALQFTLTVPSGVTLNTSSAKLTDRADGHTITMECIDSYYSNQYMVMVFSNSNKAVLGRTGTIATINMTTSSYLTVGSELQLSLSSVVISDNDGANICTGFTAGTLEILQNPDLEVSDVKSSTTSVGPNEKLNISWQVANIGETSTEDGWKEQIYLDATNGTSKLLGTVYYSEILAADGIVSRSAELTLPSTIGLDGNAKIRVKLIPNNKTGEPSTLRENNTASSEQTISVSKLLSINSTSVYTEERLSRTLSFYLSRSGNTTNEETFTLSATADSRVSLPNEVTIPKGQTGAYFYAQITANKVLDNDSIVDISLSGNGYGEIKSQIKIEDDTFPSLSIESKSQDVKEGEKQLFTITTQRAARYDIAVNLSCDYSTRFSIPSSIVIPAGETSIDVTVEALEDKIPDVEQVVTFTVSAEKHNSASINTVLVDNDIPTLQLSLSTSAVSESTGPQSVIATIRRTDITDNNITIKLSDDSNGGIYYANQTINMSAGVKEATVQLGPIDNAIVDGERTYNISAAVWISSCSCSATGTQGGVVSAPLTVYDNDGPTLTLSSSSTVLKEGGEITLTVSRNTDTTEALTVNLTSDHDSALEYPSTVVIPAGEKASSFTVKCVDNDTNDDSFTAVITASSGDFAKSNIWFTVSDQTLADAQISAFEVSASEALPSETVTATVTITNGGSYELPSYTKVAFYLDNSSKAVANTTLQNALAVGESATISQDVTMPNTIGTYNLYVKVNEDQTVKELSFGNNMSQLIPVKTIAPFKATVQTDKSIYQQGETIVVTGQLQGNDVANKDVEIYFINDYDRRTISATALADGSFSVEYSPVAGQMGHFTVGTCFASENLWEEMTSFDIYGLKTSAWSKCELAVTETHKGTITISNPGNLEQTNIKVAALEESENCEFTFSSIDKLEAGASATIAYSVKGNDVSTTQGEWQEMPIKITSAEGSVANHKFYYYVQPLHGTLHSSLSAINTTMPLSASRDYPVTIRNIGKGETGSISLSLPACVTSATPQNMPSLASGDSATVILRFVPTSDMKLNVKTTGTIGICCENGDDTQIKFAVTPVSEVKGTLRLDLVDEFTFYTEEAPHISGANVTIKKPTTNEVVANGVTDNSGIFQVELQEGWYTVNVEVDKHDSYTNQIIVDPGVIKEHEVFLPYQAVTYSWDVVETEIEDEYEIETVVKYETRVPKPIIVITLPDNRPQPNEIIPVYITNHGLINAREIELNLSASNGYSFEFLSDPTAAVLAPQQTIVFYARMIQDSTPSRTKAKAPRSSDDCFSLYSEARAIYDCGRLIGYEPYYASKSWGNCGGSGGWGWGNGGSGGSGWSGPGGPSSWGGSKYHGTSDTPKSSTTKDCPGKNNGGNGGSGDGGNDDSNNPNDPNSPVPDDEPDNSDCDETPVLKYVLVDSKTRKPFKGVAADGVSQVKIVLDNRNSKCKIPSKDCNFTIEWELSEDIGELSNKNSWNEIIYTAPEDFPSNLGSSYKITAIGHFTNGDISGDTAPVEIEIVRAPVVLMHGLGDNEDCWSKFGSYILKKGMYADYQVLNHPYTDTNTAHFKNNEKTAFWRIKKVLDDCRKNKIEANKVDYIGHSMGGILGRLCAQYVDNKIFHKLITVNTPHSGSEIGDIVSGNDKLKELAGKYVYKKNEIGAVEDLAVNSDATDKYLNNSSVLNRLDGIPCHAIVTTTNYLETTGSELLMGILLKIITHDPEYEQDYKKMQPSDLVVSQVSQEGNRNPYAVTYIFDGPNHCNSPKNNRVMDALVTLLNCKTDKVDFSKTGFHPIDRVYSHIQMSSSQAPKRVKSEKNIGKVQFLSNVENNRLNVSVVNEDDFSYYTLVANFGESFEPAISTCSNLETEIPSAFNGDIKVYAYARDNNMVSSLDSITINVIESRVDLKAIWSDTLYCYVGEMSSPVLKCEWEDGTITKVTPDNVEFDKQIAQFESGYITPLKGGQCNVTYSFRDKSCIIPIIIYDFQDKSTNKDDENSESICSTITLSFKQQAVMTRQAFRGTLTLNNGYQTDELKDFKLNLEVRNDKGELMGRNMFEIAPDSLKGFVGEKDFNAGWSLAPAASGVATVLFIPTKYAAPTEPKDYSFGGSFSYTDPSTGTTVTRELNPITLTVNPSPNLDLTYFMQRDVIGDDPLTEDVVEPCEEAEFSLLINNKGYGDAKNLRMTTKQPEIIENEKGLAINFELMSSQLNGGEKSLALGGDAVTEFGTIEAQKTAYAQWWIKSSLLGHFTDYDVKATHVTSYDNPDLSLLDSVSIHELIRSIEIVDGEAKMVGFMTNDIPDANDTPDMLYLSNGEIEEVAEASTASIVKTSDTDYALTITPSRSGWNYGNVVDPTYGVATLRSVVRQSDGKEISLRNFWLTDRTLRDGKDPLYENRIHFAENFGSSATETYVLTFDPVPELLLEVASIENTPAEGTIATAPVDSISVMFNKAVDPMTFTSEDITLAVQGVKQNVESVKITTKDNKTFALDLTDVNKSCGNGYYVLTVQTANITDAEGFCGKVGKSASWNMFQDGLVKVNTTVSPEEAGVVTGAVNAFYGDTITLAATANKGYEFAYWTVDGNKGTSATKLECIVTDNTDIVANFIKKSYSVTIDNDNEGGIISGAYTGIYPFGQELTLSFAPNDGYLFKGWIVNDELIGKGASLTVTVDSIMSISAKYVNNQKYNQVVELSKGWNWVSGYLKESLPVESLLEVTNRIVGQFDETIKDPDLGFVGEIENLELGKAYKIDATSDFSATFTNYLYDLDESPIVMKRGWNWIAYPYYESRNINSVVTNAEEGDYIASQYGFTSYADGYWEGSINQFHAGQGYLYKSATDKTLAFDFDAVTPKAMVKVKDGVEANAGSSVDVHKYPNTITVS